MCYLYLDWYRCTILISTGVLVLLPACEDNLTDSVNRRNGKLGLSLLLYFCSLPLINCKPISSHINYV